MDVSDQQRGKDGKEKEEKDTNKPTYCVTDVPPWYICTFLAIQVGVTRILKFYEYLVNIFGCCGC